jgi:hypothetical protein
MTHNATRGMSLRQKLEYWSMPEPNSGCLLWLGAAQNGYGQLLWDGRTQLAHRLMWMVHNGPLPSPKTLICHRCDNPSCIEITHLFRGDHQINSDDKVRKGRQSRVRGNANGCSSLDEATVREILSSLLSDADLAARFGMSRSGIGRIRRRDTWAHIELAQLPEERT